MQKSLKYKSILSILVLLVGLWIVFYTAKFLNVKGTSDLEQFIPKDAQVVVRTNSKSIIKRFLTDVLYKSDFERKTLEKFNLRESNQDFKGFGIDITKHIIFFYEDWREKDVIGILVNLSDVKDFSALGNNKNIFTATNGKYGCLLYLPSAKNNNKDVFSIYTEDILKRNRDTSLAKLNLKKFGKSNGHFDVYFSGNQKSKINDLILQLTISNEEILIEGQAKKNPTIVKDTLPEFFLKTESTNHLAFKIGSLPDTLEYYLSSVLNKIHVNLPKIKSQHIQLYGVGLENVASEMVVQPYFDGIFRFKDTLTLSNKISQITDVNDKIATISVDTIKIGNTNYFLKQLSNKDVFIGVTPNPEIYVEENAPIFYIKGEPEAILNINGNGWIADIARAIPQIRNSNSFFKEIEQFEIEAREGNNLDVTVQGKIAFAKNEQATLKIIDFFLSFVKAPVLSE